jgi:predicted PurR-regulated permease PerM
VGQLLISLLNGLVAVCGFFFLGIPHALWWGALAGLCSLIPVVGSVFGFLPVLIAAWLARHNGWTLLGVAGVWALVQLSESFLWQPKILGNKLNINPWLVVPIMFLGGLFFGVIGAVLSVPLVAIAQAGMRRLTAK